MMITQASFLVSNFGGANIIADRGCDLKALIEQIKNQKCNLAIPSKLNLKNIIYHLKALDLPNEQSIRLDSESICLEIIDLF